MDNFLHPSIPWICSSPAAGACAWKRFWSWACACNGSGNAIGLVSGYRTRDASRPACTYMRALLTLTRERNFKNMDRRLNGGDGQAFQQFTPRLSHRRVRGIWR